MEQVALQGRGSVLPKSAHPYGLDLCQIGGNSSLQRGKSKHTKKKKQSPKKRNGRPQVYASLILGGGLMADSFCNQQSSFKSRKYFP